MRTTDPTTKARLSNLLAECDSHYVADRLPQYKHLISSLKRHQRWPYIDPDKIVLYCETLHNALDACKDKDSINRWKKGAIGLSPQTTEIVFVNRRVS